MADQVRVAASGQSRGGASGWGWVLRHSIATATRDTEREKWNVVVVVAVVVVVRNGGVGGGGTETDDGDDGNPYRRAEVQYFFLFFLSASLSAR